MTEARGTCGHPKEQPDRGAAGVERVGDVLRRLIDERGWWRLERLPQVNGNRPGTNDRSWHGDA